MVTLNINGHDHSVDVPNDTPLLWVLAVSKRLLKKVRIGSGSEARRLHGVPMP